ncbi:MAG: hypothetical protein JRC68_01215 [Deltaproteobacteria bacterium]|nr:hypothetical protein [Deltaproteobacteria bacterium]
MINPFYTQHVCHAIWELCEAKDQVTEETVEDGRMVVADWPMGQKQIQNINGRIKIIAIQEVKKRDERTY